ncbi:unnamed protein product [Effrenium voratum]|nr:unnamed protein product [Effrenium voratum]
MAESSVRRLSRKIAAEGQEPGDTPSFLRKTVAVAVKGNEARQKWKQLENRCRESDDESPSKRSTRHLGTMSSPALEAIAAKEALERVPLYSACSQKCLEALAAVIRTRLVGLGAPVQLEGDTGDCMHILVRGEVEVLKGDEVQETHEDSGVFGEMASISKNPSLALRCATVRTKSLCDFKVLHREDVTQALSHFKEDAVLLERRVEERVRELREKGEMPAKKEWWRLEVRRSTQGSACSVPTEGFRTAVGQAIAGLRMRRFSTAGPGAAGPSGHSATLPLRRRMSDGAALMPSMIRNRLTSSLTSQASAASAACAAIASAAQPKIESGEPEPNSSSGEEEEVQQAQSLRVPDSEPNSGSASLSSDSPRTASTSKEPVDESPAVGCTIKFQDFPDVTSPEPVEASRMTGPSLPELERTLSTLKSNSVALREEPDASLRARLLRRRDVALHPFNQGGPTGGFLAGASRQGMRRAQAAALRVCRKAPITAVAARHQEVTSKLPAGRLTKPTVASKVSAWRNPQLKLKLPKVFIEQSPAESVALERRTLWQEFQARSAIVCS